MKPLVKNEWRRLLARLRRHGPDVTCSHVVRLIETKKYPLALSDMFCERLLKMGEYDAAGKVLKAIKQSGGFHPLVEEHYSAWLWCTGRYNTAISFTLKSARFWQRPYLFQQLGTLYHLMAKRKGTNYYRKKADHYKRLASAMAIREELNPAEKINPLKRVETMNGY